MTTVTTAMQQLLNEDTTSTRPNFVPTLGVTLANHNQTKRLHWEGFLETTFTRKCK